MKYLKILLVSLFLFSINTGCLDDFEDFHQADENTQTIHFTKLGGVKILTADKYIVHNSDPIKVTRWYYKNYLNKDEELEKKDTDGNGLLLENEWISILISNNSPKYAITVKPNMKKRKRNVFFRIKGDVEFSFNLYQD